MNTVMTVMCLLCDHLLIMRFTCQEGTSGTTLCGEAAERGIAGLEGRLLCMFCVHIRCFNNVTPTCDWGKQQKIPSPEPGWAEEEHSQRFGAPETNPGKLRIAPSTRSGVADVS